MFGGINTNAQAMSSLLQKHETISNNLANIATSGFKRDGVSFHSVLEGAIDGSPTTSSYIDQTTGTLKSTDNPLDLSILGDGFFSVQTAQGVRYTRDGSFQLDSKGQVVTRNGDALLTENGPINISKEELGELKVNENGQIYVGNVEKGKLNIMNFEKGSDVKKVGQNLYQLLSGTAKTLNSKVSQGTIENSNVNSVQEMAELMDTMRLFESNQKLIRMQDEVLGKAISQLA